LLILLSSFGIPPGQDQPVRMVSFSQIENYFNMNSDTVQIISFWATWCGPCRKEIPDLEKIHQLYSDRKVKVLLISLDFPDQLNKGLPQFLKSNHITAKVLLLNDPDANAWIDKVDPKWTGSLPATLIYKGKDRFFYEKELSFDDLNRSIISLKP
jgi:thiol-disulfide isomerase/thioredoxin